jgi:hypothetical protein
LTGTGWGAADKASFAPIIARYYLLPFVVIFETNDVVFAQVITELYFDERERLGGAVAQAMISFRGDVYVLSTRELKLTLPAYHVGDSGDHYPVLVAPRMALQAEACARFHLQPFDLIAFAFL